MDLLLHPTDERTHTAPVRRGRLSTVGHGAAFRAFARAARRAGVRFMVIGGTFRDVAVRAASTRDIDIVLVDRRELDAAMMRRAGFAPVPREPHCWRRVRGGHTVELQVAATASSTASEGPFSVAYLHAGTRVIEGVRVAVPRVEDYVVLKLLAALRDRRRRARDLADVQFALEAYPRVDALSVPALRARLRDLYGLSGERLRDAVALLRHVPRPRE